VHYLELDQIIGEKFVVTAHGPINPAVPIEVALRETETVHRRIRSGRLRPNSPFELSYAISSALTHRLEGFIEELTRDVWKLEQRVTGGHMGAAAGGETHPSGRSFAPNASTVGVDRRAFGGW
jgi:magnesium transporter